MISKIILAILLSFLIGAFVWLVGKSADKYPYSEDDRHKTMGDE